MSTSLIVVALGAAVATAATAVLAARCVQAPRTFLIAWTVASFALAVALGAQLLGGLTHYSAPAFRAMELGAQLVGPVALSLGVAELVARSLAARFGLRLLLSAITIVAAVVLSIDPLGANASFGKQWPDPFVYYQPVPTLLIEYVIAPVTALIAVIGIVVTAARARRDPGSRARMAAVAAAALALLALAAPGLAQLGRRYHGPALPDHLLFAASCVLAAALTWFAGMRAARLGAPPRASRAEKASDGRQWEDRPGRSLPDQRQWDDEAAAGFGGGPFGSADRGSSLDSHRSVSGAGYGPGGYDPGGYDPEAHGPGRGYDQGAFGAGTGYDPEALGLGRGYDQGQYRAGGGYDLAYGPGGGFDQAAYGAGGVYDPAYGPGGGFDSAAHGPGGGFDQAAYGAGGGYDPAYGPGGRHDSGARRGRGYGDSVPDAAPAADDRYAGPDVNGAPDRFARRQALPAGDHQLQSQMFGQIAIYTLLDDRVDEFDQLTGRVVAQVRAREPDTLVYIVHAVPTAPMQRILYEVYRDRTAYEEHRRQPYVAAFEAERRPFVLATNVIELGLQQAKVSPFPSISDILHQTGIDPAEVTASGAGVTPGAGRSYPQPATRASHARTSSRTHRRGEDHQRHR